MGRWGSPCFEMLTRADRSSARLRLISPGDGRPSQRPAMAAMTSRVIQSRLKKPRGLGTSARIGEILAIRRCDVDVTTSPATLRNCGTVVSQRGVGTFRQADPKTDRSNRVVALPSFTAEALRRRLSVIAGRSPEALVFQSREGTPLTTANVRRQLRKVLGDAGITGVHPHIFRRSRMARTPTRSRSPSRSRRPRPPRSRR